ncbi:MAG: hypothetical protein NZM31_07725 [Gemmatales bacterium]|nr:hypothetical protein [Gemmatales bacterium]MDW8386884.1 hypothetical protein [Gemmatales bacterium]
MLRASKAGIVAFIVVLAALTPTQAQDVVLSVRSFEDLLNDVKFVLKTAGMEDRAQQLEGLLALAGGGNQPPGIDVKKPFGLYIREYTTEGQEPPVVLFLPVTKPEEFLDLLRQAGVEPGKPEKDIYAMDTPLGVSIYLKFAHGYAFGAMSMRLLEDKLPEPGKFLPAANKKNLIALTARVDKIPAEQKRQALESIEEQLKADLEKREDETEDQHRLRVAVAKALTDVVAMFIEDGQDLSTSINVDRENERLSLEIQATATKGSELAKRIKDFGPGGVTAPVHFEVSIGKVLRMFASREAEQQEQLKKLLGDDKPGQDVIKLTLSGGDAARLRLEVSGTALRVIAALIPSDLGQ